MTKNAEFQDCSSTTEYYDEEECKKAILRHEIQNLIKIIDSDIRKRLDDYLDNLHELGYLLNISQLQAMKRELELKHTRLQRDSLGDIPRLLSYLDSDYNGYCD